MHQYLFLTVVLFIYLFIYLFQVLQDDNRGSSLSQAILVHVYMYILLKAVMNAPFVKYWQRIRQTEVKVNRMTFYVV